MQHMAKHPYLQQVKSGIFYYKRRWKAEHAHLFSGKFFRKSLKTKVRDIALKEYWKFEAWYQSECNKADKALEEEKAKFKPAPLPSASLDSLLAFVNRYVAEEDEASKARIAHSIYDSSLYEVSERDPAQLVVPSSKPQPKLSLQGMQQDTELELQMLQDPNSQFTNEQIFALKSRILTDAGAPVAAKDDPQFSEYVHRALIERTKRDLEYLNSSHDHLFASAPTPTVPSAASPDPETTTFGTLADIFWEEKCEEYDLNGVSKRSSNKVQAQLDLLREIIGDDTPLSSINDDTIQSLRKTLARLPSNRTKKYPKLSIAASIEQAKKDGQPSIEVLTQRGYLDCMRKAMEVAYRKGLITVNPAIGLKPLKRDKVKLSEKRKPLNEEQIATFFMGQFYHSCLPESPKSYHKKDRAWRFWVPLLMLMSGARPGEIVPLAFADIKKTSKGTYYLDVVESKDDDESDLESRKTLKTAYSRRKIPIHEELIKIGFLDFVKKRRTSAKETETYLFGNFEGKTPHQATAYACRRFKERFLIDEITLERKLQTFYSIRHSARDALRRAEAPPETLTALGGWSQGSKNVSDDYGDPGNPDLHVKWVNKISYPELDLSFLYGVGADV
nr:site-specific integrase [uncultured Cohaesibacter sp.]